MKKKSLVLRSVFAQQGWAFCTREVVKQRKGKKRRRDETRSGMRRHLDKTRRKEEINGKKGKREEKSTKREEVVEIRG